MADSHIGGLGTATSADWVLVEESGVAKKIAPDSLGASAQVMHVQRQEAQGTHGGTHTGSTAVTRQLNTVVQNDITGASLSSNQVTLPAGTYRVVGSTPFYKTNYSRCYLYNVTDAANVLLGTSVYCSSADATDATSFVRGEFTLAGTKALELRSQSTTSAATYGLGLGSNLVGVEIYDELWIEKVA